MPRLFRFGCYLVDTHQRVLFRDGQMVALSPKVLETLELLLSSEGRVVSKTEFMQVLWPRTFVEESNLTQNIFVLRRTLGTTEDGQPYIETVPKRGYRFAVSVQIADTDGSLLEEFASTEPHTAEQAGLTTREEEAPDDRGRGKPTLSKPAQAFPWTRWGWVRRGWALAGAFCLVAFVGLLGAAWRASRTEIRETGARRLTNDGVPKNLGPFPEAMVSDGKRLYFTERRNNRSVLAEVPVEGGEVSVRAAPFPDAAVASYSARDAKLLIGSVWRTAETQNLFTEDRATGKTQPLGALKGHDASFSPDGARVAFTQGRHLQIADADGSHVRPVVAGDGVVYWPRWSPDGRMLRFSENFGGNDNHIWEVTADGHSLHQILADDPNRDHICCGTWSADGRWYFYVVVAPNSSSLWAMPGNTRWWQLRRPQPEQVVPNHDIAWLAPVVSADASKLWAIGSDARAELLRVDAKTRKLEPYLGGISAEGVSFSPDGKFLTYTAYPEGTLWISHVDGSGKKQLTRRPVVARFPRWSPDGSTLAFLAGEPGSQWRLYLADLETGVIEPLLKEQVDQGVASWSPDGRKILFGRLPNYGKEQDSTLSLQIYDLQHRSLTLIEGSRGLWTPRWSPDGHYIAAVTGDNQRLRLYDTHTGTWSDLAPIGANDMVWTPDSHFVFFDAVLGTTPMLYRVRIADRKIEPWADLRNLQRGGLFGPSLGISPNGEPLLLRDRTIEEVYEISIAEVH